MEKGTTYVALDDSKRKTVAGILRPGATAPELRELPNDAHHIRRLLDKMTAEDREEAIALHEQLEVAMDAQDWDQLRDASTDLADLLFYVEEG